MSDVIRLLPDSVANQIAAGEVIQRPASVVKELVENAVDAGADNITLVIKDAGRTLIQVVDNGCGMSDTDARLAFERHATSKISSAGDLFSLRTMGFRGEALASIVAVAQVEVKTQLADAQIGTRLVINGSRVECQEPCATSPGTNMMVKNLFFNVPARRKFLKKDSVELNNILREFERLALVNPDRQLTLVHNDTTLHQLIRGSLRQRIGSLFGKSVEKQLVPIATETSIVKISGFVGLPESSRRRGALQYFFVNGRNMRHPYFHKAVLHCYEQLISADHQPNYFINFEIDPSTIDVNIHPTKNEIKFEREQEVWQILVAAIRESLGRFNVAPAIDFNPGDDVPEIPAFSPDVKGLDSLDPGPSYNPFAQSSTPRSSSARTDAQWRRETSSTINNWERLYDRFNAPRVPSDDVPYNPFAPETDNHPSFDIPSRTNSQPESLPSNTSVEITQPLIQVKSKYIVTPGRRGLILVDQHRAHVLVLFNEMMSRETSDPMPSQQVMFAETLELSPDRATILSEIMDEIINAGYQLSPAGDNAWSIEGVPTLDIPTSHAELLTDIIDDVAEGADVAREAVRRVTCLRLARAAAIRAGRTLTVVEMDHLLSSLMSQPAPGFTPDGNRIIVEIDMDDIENMF